MAHNTFFVLAPMDDVTDTVFRRVVADCAPADYTVTEFVNVDGLCSRGRSKVIRKLGVEVDTTPVIAQIWGKTPENFEQIAYEIANGLLGDSEYEKWLVEQRRVGQNTHGDGMQGASEARSKTYKEYVDASTGVGNAEVRTKASSATSSARRQARPVSNFVGVDLNFGCPEKNVIKNECCSALAQPQLRGKALAIIEATKRGAGDFPLSIKTRLGFGEIDYTWHEFLLNQKPAMLTVHVRTTRQMSKVPAQWEAIEPIVALRDKISPDTKIVLNGDITSRKQGMELAEKHGVDGIMIGRGIFHDPYAFASPTTHQPSCQLAEPAGVCECPSPWKSVSREDRIKLLIKHIELHDKIYPDGERPFSPLKKFAKVYISDFPGASELRDRIMRTNTVEEALSLLSELEQ